MTKIEFARHMLLFSRHINMLLQARHGAKFNLSFLDVDVDVVTIVNNDNAKDVVFYFNDEKIGGRSAARVHYAKLCGDALYYAITEEFGAQLDNVWSIFEEHRK